MVNSALGMAQEIREEYRVTAGIGKRIELGIIEF